MNNLEQAAKILVECGYCDSYERDKRIQLQHNSPFLLVWRDSDLDNIQVVCNPFLDTLESIHQLHAIETWLNSTVDNRLLWMHSMSSFGFPDNKHNWRLERVNWCLSKLSKD